MVVISADDWLRENYTIKPCLIIVIFLVDAQDTLICYILSFYQLNSYKRQNLTLTDNLIFVVYVMLKLLFIRKS